MYSWPLLFWIFKLLSYTEKLCKKFFFLFISLTNICPYAPDVLLSNF